LIIVSQSHVPALNFLVGRPVVFTHFAVTCTYVYFRQVIGWRTLPVDNSELGAAAKGTEPSSEQCFVKNVKGASKRGVELHASIRCSARPPHFQSL